jgi:predicted PurR-regulated permease PerM
MTYCQLLAAAKQMENAADYLTRPWMVGKGVGISPAIVVKDDGPRVQIP